MTLPEITIPLQVPIELPTLLHPPIVHFAIALPVLILLFEVINLFLNSRSLKVITSLLLFLTVFILFGAYLSGVTDGKAVIDSETFKGMADLKEHKLLGIYLVYASIALFVIKLLALVINKIGFRIFYILLSILFVASILNQGKEGGELVYKYGANVQVQSDGFDDDEEDEDSLPKVEQKEVQSKKETTTDNQKSTSHNKEKTQTQTEEKKESQNLSHENNNTENNSTNQ